MSKYKDQHIEQSQLSKNQTITSQYTKGGILAMKLGLFSSIFVARTKLDLKWCKSQIKNNKHLSLKLKKELYNDIKVKQEFVNYGKLNKDSLVKAYNTGESSFWK